MGLWFSIVRRYAADLCQEGRENELDAQRDVQRVSISDSMKESATASMSKQRIVSWFLIAAFVAASAACDDDVIIAPPIDDTPLTPATVRLVPSAASYRVGNNVPIEVYIENATNVASVPMHVRFNPLALQYISSAEGTFLSDDGTETFFLAVPTPAGDEVVVGLSRAGSGPGVSGAGFLVTFEFLAISPGDAGFAFSGADVRDPQGKSLPARFTTVTVRVEP